MSRPPSELRIQANRLNAQKSTGPRTAEGKARSRLNGITHGLAARAVVPPEAAEAAEAEVRRWVAELGSVCGAEEALIRRAALAHVRGIRCQTAETRALGASTREAVQRWEDRKRASVRKRGQRLKEEPDVILAQLEGSAFGCDWLLRHWRALLGMLDERGLWEGDDLARFWHLTGRPATRPPIEDAEGRDLWEVVTALEPSAGPGAPLDAGEGPSIVPGDAREELRLFVLDQIDRLEARREEAWAEVDGPEYEGVVAGGLVDTGREGRLRQRYDGEADRSLNRNLGSLIRLRRQRDEVERRDREENRKGWVHREHVGGGWWKETNATPAPPGFARQRPAWADPVDAPATRPPSPAPSEPKPPVSNPGDSCRNTLPDHEFRRDTSPFSPEPIKRTDTVPGAGTTPGSPPSAPPEAVADASGEAAVPPLPFPGVPDDLLLSQEL